MALVKRFNVVRLDMAATTPLIAPDSSRTDARASRADRLRTRGRVVDLWR